MHYIKDNNQLTLTLTFDKTANHLAVWLSLKAVWLYALLLTLSHVGAAE